MTTHDARGGSRLPRITVRPGLAVSVAIVTVLLGWLTLPTAVPDRPTSSYVSGGLLGAGVLLAILVGADLLRARAAVRGGLTVTGIVIGAFGSRLLLAPPDRTGTARWTGGWPDRARRGAGRRDLVDPIDQEPTTSGGPAEGQVGTSGRQTTAATDRPDPGSTAVTAAIARAGLLTTGLAGAVLVALGALSPGGTLAVAAQVALWVGTFALLITLVDLVPAPGSPGGRILAAAVLRRTGSQQRAEAVVARSGVVIGWALIGLGVAACFLVGIIGLWAVLLGWLALGSSRVAQARQRTDQAFDGVFVRDVMARAPATIASWRTVGEVLDEVARPAGDQPGGSGQDIWSGEPGRPGGLAAGRLVGHPVGHTVFAVRDLDDSLLGVALLRDLAAVPMDDRALARVGRYTIPFGRVATARPDEPLAVVAPRLVSRPAAGCVVVLDDDPDGRRMIVGLVGPAEITQAARTAPPRGHAIIQSGPGAVDR